MRLPARQQALVRFSSWTLFATFVDDVGNQLKPDKMNCTLCESPLKLKQDDYYFRCSNCDALVKNSIFYVDANEEKATYEEHNNDVNDPRYQNFTSPITNYILENFSKNQLGLDYGCGTGPVISKQLEKSGFSLVLYDPFFYPDSNYLNSRYDFIFACEVFEHFHNPKQEIEKLLSLLKPQGELIIMTHLYDDSKYFQNWYYRKDYTHVFIYTEKTMLFIARKYNLEVIQMGERFQVLRKIKD
jgi:2-polyprenyl-3-methyl-5-hydroxy-6-metoxy-1,4-benzoquinol methylase